MPRRNHYNRPYEKHVETIIKAHPSETVRGLARELGMPAQNVRDIRNGKTYKDVLPEVERVLSGTDRAAAQPAGSTPLATGTGTTESRPAMPTVSWTSKSFGRQQGPNQWASPARTFSRLPWQSRGPPVL